MTKIELWNGKEVIGSIHPDVFGFYGKCIVIPVRSPKAWFEKIIVSYAYCYEQVSPAEYKVMTRLDVRKKSKRQIELLLTLNKTVT